VIFISTVNFVVVLLEHAAKEVTSNPHASLSGNICNQLQLFDSLIVV